MGKPGQEEPISKKTYFQQSQDWEASRIGQIEKSEKRAWHVAIAALIAFVMAASAILIMMPLKKNIPYLITVDKTGVPDIVTIMDPKTISENEALNKHYLYTYVGNRERYNWYTLQQDYDYVLLYSSPNVSREFASKYEGPDAIDKKNGKSIMSDIKVISVVPTGTNTGTIRFQRTTKREGEDGPPLETTKWIATVVFQYSGEPAKENERALNPLGFKVLSYRVDPELSGSAL